MLGCLFSSKLSIDSKHSSQNYDTDLYVKISMLDLKFIGKHRPEGKERVIMLPDVKGYYKT